MTHSPGAHAGVLSAALAATLGSSPCRAQNYWNEEEAGRRPAARVDFPLLDAPYNFVERRKGYSWLGSPSMGQSMGVGVSFYHLTHAGLGALADPNHVSFWPRFFTRFGFFAFDFLTADFPGYAAWTHEEWHRAVMTRRGVSSYNEINDYFKGRDDTGAIAVSGVRDDGLARMKREANQDFTRLQSASLEAQWEQNRRFAFDSFFHGTTSFNLGVMWFNHINAYSYLDSCTSGGSDDIIEKLDERGEPERKRDFTGPDCTGWVYDLYRPDEPYAARGRHPTGVGVDRYRATSDLTKAERSYLSRAKRLALINFVDPFAYGFEDFWYVTADGTDVYYNARLFHYLTSFGLDTGAQVYFKVREFKGYAALHVYTNRKTAFPGAELHWVEARPFAAAPTIAVSPRAMAWTQPERLRFGTKSHKPGGLLAVRVDSKEPAWAQPWVEVQGKSEGWVAGEEYQDKGLALRLGVASEF
jgi:hypothetical protein